MGDRFFFFVIFCFCFNKTSFFNKSIRVNLYKYIFSIPPLFLPPTIFYLFTFSFLQPNELLKLLMINLCGILVELTCFMYKQIYELLCHISHWIEQKTKAFNKFTFVWRHHRKTRSRWRWSGCRYSLKSAHLCGIALVKQI